MIFLLNKLNSYLIAIFTIQIKLFLIINSILFINTLISVSYLGVDRPTGCWGPPVVNLLDIISRYIKT